MTRLHEIAQGVLVATSRVMSTTSTVLVGGGRALVIDPAWLPSELEALADEAAGLDLEAIGGFATHAHHDHPLWHPGFGDAPRWASHPNAWLAETEREALLAHLGPDFPTPLAELMGRVTGCREIPAASVPSGVDIELIVHNGHAPGHSALWLPGPKVRRSSFLDTGTWDRTHSRDLTPTAGTSTTSSAAARRTTPG